MTATRTKRILSVQPVSDGGGSEHALVGMVRQLVADGWECHVAVPGPARLAPEYAAAGARLHIVGMERLTSSGGAWRWARYGARWPTTVLRLARLARTVDAEVIHSNSLHSWYGWAVAAVVGKPHVWHAREVVFQSDHALALERLLCRRFADRVIVVSEAVARQLPGAPVVIVTDEVDPDRFRPGAAGRFRSAEAIGDGVPLIGSVARIDTWKGFGTLLDAFDRLRRDRPDVELVIAGGTVQGKEDYASGIRARAERTPGVHWMGPRRDVEEVMADLDVFVQVSSEPEPFGLVVVEALASGVPVVAGCEGGPLEILGDAAARGRVPAGRLVPPDDAEATAIAVQELLPAVTSTADRRSRPPLRTPGGEGFCAVFDGVLAGQALSPRRRRGRGRPWRRRPRPS